jgi:hypothetical protein
LENPAHRHHYLVSTPTELLESGDETASFGSQGLRIAFLARIDDRTMETVDKLHKRIPELRELERNKGVGKEGEGRCTLFSCR